MAKANLEQSCKTIEKMLQRDMKGTIKPFLTPSEFHAINKILLELEVLGYYKHEKENCDYCNGKGEFEGREEMIPCDICGGSGEV